MSPPSGGSLPHPARGARSLPRPHRIHAATTSQRSRTTAERTRDQRAAQVPSFTVRRASRRYDHAARAFVDGARRAPGNRWFSSSSRRASARALAMSCSRGRSVLPAGVPELQPELVHGFGQASALVGFFGVVAQQNSSRAGALVGELGQLLRISALVRGPCVPSRCLLKPGKITSAAAPPARIAPAARRSKPRTAARWSQLAHAFAPVWQHDHQLVGREGVESILCRDDGSLSPAPAPTPKPRQPGPRPWA